MHIQYHDNAPTDEIRREVDATATELLTKEPETRAEAAKIVRAHGFADYVGGRHVAIHQRGPKGEIVGERLALVTHDAPDWN